MPDINLSQIQQRLLDEAAKSYTLGVYTPDDVLSVVLSGVNLAEVNIIVVDSIDYLPNLYYSTYPSGMIYFINDIGIFAISATNKWLTLDGITIRTDTFIGDIWSWGCNGQGQLGDNSATDRSSPVSVVGFLTDWCQVSAGCVFSLAVTESGTVWAWGCNGQGQLGDNTTVSKSSPVTVSGIFIDWCQVSAGYVHSLAVRRNGTAWAWGSGQCGRLGDNTTASKSSPVSVVGGFIDWCQLSAGGGHSLGVRQNGTLWAWGCNNFGQVGDNTTASKSSPVSVVGGFTDWCQVSTGYSTTIGVRQDGTAWAWGSNSSRQLGDNSTTTRSSPVSVVGGFTDWCQVSTARTQSLAVRQNGTAWSWGAATSGILGNNSSTDNRSSPGLVVGGFTDWCRVSAGCSHSLGLKQDGTAWSWGCNGAGRLGDNSVTDKSSPVSVVGGFTDWCRVSAGFNDSLGTRLR